MKKTYIPNCKVREFEEQVDNIFDCREGVVMDSYTGILKTGEFFAALDTYETCYTSGLTVYTSKVEEFVLAIWDRFTADYDREFTEE